MLLLLLLATMNETRVIKLLIKSNGPRAGQLHWPSPDKLLLNKH